MFSDVVAGVPEKACRPTDALSTARGVDLCLRGACPSGQREQVVTLLAIRLRRFESFRPHPLPRADLPAQLCGTYILESSVYQAVTTYHY